MLTKREKFQPYIFRQKFVAGLILLALVVVLSYLFLLRPEPAYACSTPPDYNQKSVIAYRVNFAQLVLAGKVISTTTVVTLPGNSTPSIYPPLTMATVQVQRYFKGNGPETVTITGFGEGPEAVVL